MANSMFKSWSMLIRENSLLLLVLILTEMVAFDIKYIQEKCCERCTGRDVKARDGMLKHYMYNI